MTGRLPASAPVSVVKSAVVGHHSVAKPTLLVDVYRGRRKQQRG